MNLPKVGESSPWLEKDQVTLSSQVASQFVSLGLFVWA